MEKGKVTRNERSEAEGKEKGKKVWKGREKRHEGARRGRRGERAGLDEAGIGEEVRKVKSLQQTRFRRSGPHTNSRRGARVGKCHQVYSGK